MGNKLNYSFFDKVWYLGVRVLVRLNDYLNNEDIIDKPINIVQKDNITLLYYALKNYNYKLLKHLLDNEENTNIIGNSEGISPLLFSFYNTSREVTELLLKYGADINIKNYTNKNNNLNGNTILIQAVRKRFDIKTINYILEKGADINLSNNNGETPLHTICMRITKSTSKQDIEILETLLKYGADITAKTTNEIKTKYYTFPKGSTPLDIIKIKNARKIENILKNHLSKL
ncbi:MAG: ankyrin repeat domain-containing protein [Candidatus Sericytochromatia bacterium]